MNPHQVTRDFENAVAEYTGAPHVVAVSSCTMALLLAVAWHIRPTEADKDRGARAVPLIEIPSRTYVGVAMSICHAGGRPTFNNDTWDAYYQLKPLPVFDSARWFSSNLYPTIENLTGVTAPMVCVSFHASKTLGLEQGGAILFSDPAADEYLRRARFDGRASGVAPEDDTFKQLSWHCYMNPSTAALGILKLYSLPKHNKPLPNDPYPNLSTMEVFR